MATVHEIPSLDGLLDSILDRLAAEVVESLASMRPQTPKRKGGGKAAGRRKAMRKATRFPIERIAVSDRSPRDGRAIAP